MQDFPVRTERFENTVSVEEYVDRCVDVEQFLRCCKECHNYNKIWSCPPYDFHPEDYWRQYKTFRIIGIKIFLPEELLSGTYTKEEQQIIFDTILFPQKEKLNKDLLALEKEYPGSVSLSGGSCQQCKADHCMRKEGLPCRFPDTMRYSIESLGGNVGLTVTKYLYQELQWMEEGKLPPYFMLVGGLLLP